MKMLEPTIQVNKLVIIKDKKVAYSGIFKSGLNVITGSNSSGKTTILDLIAYTLGMEEIKLKQEALSCDYSYLEILINGSPLVLKREISETSRRPIAISYNLLDLAHLSEFEWATYPIGRSEKISFSQIMFNLMDSSENNIDASSNITMHQILRCIYASQPYLHFPILTPAIHDDILTRKTIGEYLLGFYDNELYIKQIKYKEKLKEKAKLTTELNFLKNIFKKSYFSFNNKLSALNHLSKLNKEKLQINGELHTKKRTPKKIEKENSKLLESLNIKINHLTLDKNKFEQDKNKLFLNSLDSKIFINELKDRLERLEESNFIQSYSQINFEFCPSCLSKLQNNSSNSCNLCKCETDNKDSLSSPLLRMKNELLIQLEESKKIESLRNVKIDDLNLKLINTVDMIRSLSIQLNNLNQHWSDDEKAYISNLSFRLGKLDAEITEINKLIPIYDELSNIESHVKSIDSDIKILESEISRLEETNYQQRLNTLGILKENLCHLLKMDLPRETEFINPTHIDISFSDNQIYVNNKNKFSESSTVVLRHLFHLAILKTADSISHMRFPRFLILDGIDDGGLEPERILNLQNIILETINSLNNSHQIIIGTSKNYLNESMENFVYNRIFDSEAKSLII